MNPFEKKKSTFLYSVLLYLCSFLLFLEWIYPLDEVSDTSGISIFVAYTLYCFVISFLPLRWWMAFILKGLGLIFFVHWLFLDQNIIFSVSWIEQIISEFSFNTVALISQDWYYLTPLFRTILFFILIWLMSYLLHYWFVEMKRIFLFILLTFIYITVLDTFTEYDAGLSIVRAFIIALVALAITTIQKELSHITIGFSWLKGLKSLIFPLLMIIAFSTVIGFIVPKVEPQWPDPVPFIYSASSGASGIGDGVQKVGYGEDDSRLGGSFVQDHTPVFTSYVYDRHYWRIETKDIYTGKGWELSQPPEYRDQPNGEIQLETFSNQVATENLTAMIFMHDFSIGKLLYPYGVYQARERTNGSTLFALDENSEAIETKIPSSPENLVYEVDYHRPSFDIHQLRNISDEDPRDIVEEYTQLPSTLPDRVQRLAVEITDEHEKRYDQVKAVEQYFHQNGFEYQTTDIPIPEADEDYVDQFLFDSKVGYCDNFSTSMVVLLRTLDIPARWVKGFTSGERIESNFGEKPDVYQVTNANAHSWVEVYFPETGWVPFEPTQGFSSPADFYYGDTEKRDVNQEEPDELPEEVIEEEPEELEEEEAAPEFNFLQEDEQSSEISNWLGIFASIILLITGVILFKRRYHLLTKRFSRKLDQSKDAKDFQDAYHYLIKLLHHKGYRKPKEETLREFARTVDTNLETNEMSQLTSVYERMLYKNELSDEHSTQATELWKNLVNRLIG